MTGRFLIVGQPRSRLAWLSVAASGYKSIAYHEPVKFMRDWHEVDQIWRASRYPYAGIADSILGFHLPEIIERWEPRILIVERSLVEVEAAVAKVYPDLPSTNYCTLLAAELAKADHPSIKRVAFDRLSDWSTVFEALRHLMPDARLDIERIQQLIPLRITADSVAAFEAARSGNLAGQMGQSVVDCLRLTG